MPNIAGPGKCGFLLLSLSVALVSVPGAAYGDDQAAVQPQPNQGVQTSGRFRTKPINSSATVRGIPATQQNAGNAGLPGAATSGGPIPAKGTNMPAIFDRWGNSAPKTVDGGTKATTKPGGDANSALQSSRMSANEASASGALNTTSTTSAADPKSGGGKTVLRSTAGEPIPGVNLPEGPAYLNAAPAKGGKLPTVAGGEANSALGQVSTTRGKVVEAGKDPVGPAGAPVVTSRSNKRAK